MYNVHVHQHINTKAPKKTQDYKFQPLVYIPTEQQLDVDLYPNAIIIIPHPIFSAVQHRTITMRETHADRIYCAPNLHKRSKFKIIVSRQCNSIQVFYFKRTNPYDNGLLKYKLQRHERAHIRYNVNILYFQNESRHHHHRVCAVDSYTSLLYDQTTHMIISRLKVEF